MKLEQEFRAYLQEVWVSERTRRSMSPKATGDAVSRCKRAERTVSCELSPSIVKTEDAYQNLLDRIRAHRIGSTNSRPYAYTQIVYSVKLYREFVDWRREQHSIIHSRDQRRN